jgi:hypothetical protein
MVYICEPAKAELKGFSREDQERVAEAISILEDDSYREQNKIDLVLVEDGCKIWALIVGIVWLAFYEDGEDVQIVWLSLRSRFRPF